MRFRQLAQAPARTAAFSRRWVRVMWLSLAIMDLIWLYGIWLRYQRFAGRVVLCDRYLEDTSLDFALNFKDDEVSTWWLWRWLEWWTPTPDAAFLLLISTAESQRRSRQKQEPFPDSPGNSGTSTREYETWSDPWTVLDGMEPAADLGRQIAESVNRIISKNTEVAAL